MSRDKGPLDPTPLRGLLGGAAARFGLDDALAAATLWKDWREIAGPDLAGHAEPTSLRRGILRIRAESPVWAHEIAYLADEIKLKVNEALGTSAVVEVKVWSAPGRPAAPLGQPPPAAVPGEVRRADADSDQDPARALERARSAWAQRRSTDGDRGR